MPFITFEGIDGSGKSTLLKNFAQYLKRENLPCEVTREPGGSDLGLEVRNLLLKVSDHPPCARAELLLYEADRAQHVETKIRPWLKKNIWVLCDRFTDSSLAFQGAGRKIATPQIAWLNDFATSSLIPDLTILVDLPVDVALSRRADRNPDRFENEKAPFHEAVRKEYLSMASKEKRFFELDGTLEPEKLLEDLIHEVKKRKLL